MQVHGPAIVLRQEELIRHSYSTVYMIYAQYIQIYTVGKQFLFLPPLPRGGLGWGKAFVIENLYPLLTSPLAGGGTVPTLKMGLGEI